MDWIGLGKQRLYKRKHCYRKHVFISKKKIKKPPGNEHDFLVTSVIVYATAYQHFRK